MLQNVKSTCPECFAQNLVKFTNECIGEWSCLIECKDCSTIYVAKTIVSVEVESFKLVPAFEQEEKNEK
jgi:uncharacterized Zn finger protein